MGYGRRVPDGSLPVFSVNTTKEARDLIVLCCPMNHAGQYYARELAGDGQQTLENLQRFSDRLAAGWELMMNRSKG